MSNLRKFSEHPAQVEKNLFSFLPPSLKFGNSGRSAILARCLQKLGKMEILHGPLISLDPLVGSHVFPARSSFSFPG
jgi:hypothetical protein